MSDQSVLFQHVTFAYEGATEPLLVDLSVHFARGWTGIVGANGVGKSTILKLATGLLKPREGFVAAPSSAVYCEQRTDSVPASFEEFVAARGRGAAAIRDRLGIQRDWIERWNTLSHGERKRAQIAVAIWMKPDILALDEPTNHLDQEAKKMLHDSLSRFDGVGLLVSHDRKLLDDLCFQCLFVDPPESILRPGNYSDGSLQANRDRFAALRMWNEARHEFARLKQEASRRRAEAAGADRKRSKKGLARKDHDTRARINLARVSGKDGAAGKKLRQIEGRLTQAQARVESITVRKDQTLGI